MQSPFRVGERLIKEAERRDAVSLFWLLVLEARGTATMMQGGMLAKGLVAVCAEEGKASSWTDCFA